VERAGNNRWSRKFGGTRNSNRRNRSDGGGHQRDDTTTYEARAFLAEDLLPGVPPAADATALPRLDHFARRLKADWSGRRLHRFRHAPPTPLFVAFLDAGHGSGLHA